jgi:tetratricopeptide (TPR) repeat protein
VNKSFGNRLEHGSNLRKLLQERIEKANPRRELTIEEAKRLSKLEVIAEKLRRGENVQNRQLQTWLSEEEYEQLEYEWQEQLELREELKDKPSDLKRYEEKLKQATFAYNCAEGYSSKGNHATAKKFYDKSESLCEDALEILQEILHYDSSLRVWFDRDISFEGHQHSRIIEINPETKEEVWIYKSNPVSHFYSHHISGQERLSSGNTLICEGIWGRLFEVTPAGEIV